MRIRKLISQKKICPTLPSSSSTATEVIPSSYSYSYSATVCEEERVNNNNFLQKPGVVLCELNRSPWDVISAEELLYYFPDEVYKVIKEEEYDDDDDQISVEEDQISVEENDTDTEYDDEETEEEESEEKPNAMTSKGKLGLKSMAKNNTKKRKRDDDTYEVKKKNRVAYCCKTDGIGSHCRSKAKIGSSLCDQHHTIQMHTDHQRKIGKLDDQKTPRRGRPPKESGKDSTSTDTIAIRGRRNKKGKLSAKKSSEFYYYSGFGPLWGKNKRSRPPNEVKKEQVEDTEQQQEEECVKLEVIDEAAIPVHEKRNSPTTPVMTLVKEEENDYGCMFVEDDEDTDDGVNGKKRYRKPIKARSLKSLFG